MNISNLQMTISFETISLFLTHSKKGHKLTKPQLYLELLASNALILLKNEYLGVMPVTLF